MLSTYSERHLVAEQMDRLRAEHGLSPDPDAAMLFRYLHLACEPAGFHDAALPVAPSAHLLRPAPSADSGAEALPAWLAETGDRPIVYATLGTVFNSRTPGLFDAIVDGLRDEPIDLVLTIGRDRDPAELGLQPANVHVERYIPIDALLPHCDLVVAHAGFGTVSAALAGGVPMVLIPIDADQPLNAERCRVARDGRDRSSTIVEPRGDPRRRAPSAERSCLSP